MKRIGEGSNHNILDKRHVEEAIEDVEKLLEKLKKLPTLHG